MTKLLVIHLRKLHRVHELLKAGKGSVQPQILNQIVRMGFHHGVLADLKTDGADEAVGRADDEWDVSLPEK